jgi:hypothetical protein
MVAPALLAILVLGAPGSPGADAAVERIRALYAEVNEAIAQGRAERTVYATFPRKAAPVWRRLGAKEQPPPVPDDASREVATVERLAGAVRKVTVQADTPSGDWTNTTEHYFRPDGTIAFRFERHATFLGPGDPEGPYVVERRTYVDEAGRTVRTIVRAFVRASGAEVPLAQVQQIDVDAYRRVADLPFLAPAGAGRR